MSRVKSIQSLVARVKVCPHSRGTKGCQLFSTGLAPRYFSSCHRPLSTMPQTLEHHDHHQERFRNSTIHNQHQNHVGLSSHPSFQPHSIQSPQVNFLQRDLVAPYLSLHSFIDLVPHAIRARQNLLAHKESGNTRQHQVTHDPVMALFRYVQWRQLDVQKLIFCLMLCFLGCLACIYHHDT
jgi:hypothetical protein